MSTNLIEIRGNFFDVEMRDHYPIHLVIADPPYGGIVKESWDNLTEKEALDQYVRIASHVSTAMIQGSSMYLFGGIGKPGYRPFFKAISAIESTTFFRMRNLITWKKKRAYGKKDDYLFVREEIAWFIYGDGKPRVFNIPLLDKKRAYPGYNVNYPAKSEFYRRTNVWDDITEILRGKIHPCQKPDRLYEVMVQTSSNPGERVLDPFAGSGTLARVCPDRTRILIEIE